jgi:hypothetical protein
VQMKNRSSDTASMRARTHLASAEVDSFLTDLGHVARTQHLDIEQ